MSDGFWAGIDSVPVKMIRRFGEGDQCSCVDEVYGSPDPNCPICGGKGKSKLRGIVTIRASVHQNGSETIRDDEDDDGDIHAFFPPHSGVAKGSVIIYNDKEYEVGECVVHDSYLDCTLVARE